MRQTMTTSGGVFIREGHMEIRAQGRRAYTLRWFTRVKSFVGILLLLGMVCVADGSGVFFKRVGRCGHEHGDLFNWAALSEYVCMCE